MINEALDVVEARLGQKIINKTIISEDIIANFSHMSFNQILQALKKGGLSKYGKPYKLAPIDIYIWLRTYCKENKILETDMSAMNEREKGEHLKELLKKGER